MNLLMTRLSLVCLLMTAGLALAEEEEPERVGRRKPTSYEKPLVEKVLAAKGRELDEAPEGKTIRNIYFKQFDVILEDEGRLKFLNKGHVTSRSRVIARQLIISKGDVWNRVRIEEAERKINVPTFLTLTIIIPVKTKDETVVDIFVVTRDVWSLRTNSLWEIQEDKLSLLFIGLSENNLLGLQKQVVLNYSLNLGDFYVGPSYFDPNFFWSNNELRVFAALVYGRRSGKLEGSRSSASFVRPFWSLRSKWSWGINESHSIGFRRSFLGTQLRNYDVPETMAIETIPFEYKRSTVNAEAFLTRSFGKRVLKRITASYSVNFAKSEVPAELSGVSAASFERDVLARTENSSGPSLGLSIFRNNFHIYKNLESFGVPESRNLSPTLSLSAFLSPKLLGSTNDYLNLSASASFSAKWFTSGYVTATTGFSARYDTFGLIDRTATGRIKAISPTLPGFRLAANVRLSARFKERNNAFYTIGGQTGLRGYPIGAFAGQRRLQMNFEARSLPLKWKSVSLGGVLFYDAGHAANSFSELTPFHNVGFGGRLMIPQIGAIINRLDIAFPLNGVTKGKPRLVIGVQQVF